MNTLPTSPPSPDLSCLANICIVLVEPLRAGNIGSVARAMKTMGLHSLRMVRPHEFPHHHATMMAVHASDLLERSQLFDDLPSAIADCHVVFGTSARSRYLPQPFLEASEGAHKIVSLARGGQKIAILFGKEDKGLSNDDLNLCNFHLGISADPTCAILNISHAVQVIAYLIYSQLSQGIVPHHKATAHSMPSTDHHWDQPLASHQSMMVLLEQVVVLMEKIDFYDEKKSKLLLSRLKRLLLRVPLDQMEANILLGIINETIKKIPSEAPAPAGTP